VSGHVFISYSRTDRSYVDRLAAHLAGAGIPVWYDYDMEAGDRFAAVIQQSIDTCAAFVVVLSPASIDSPWVNREISYATTLGRPVLPLQLTPCRPHILLIDLHADDVTGGTLPPDRFTARLRGLLLSAAAEHAAARDRPRVAEPERRLVQVLAGLTRAVSAVAWTPDGRAIATGCWDKNAQIWDPATGEIQATLTGHTKPLTSIAWSPDGRRLATGARDNTAAIWDPARAERSSELTGHRDHVRAVAWSPDGAQLATASSDATVRIWTDAGAVRLALTGHEAYVNAVAWSPDGRTLATGSYDNTARLWNAADGTEQAVLTGHRSGVAAVAWFPDGRLATGSWDQTVRVWDVETGKCVEELTGHTDAVTSVAVAPDGRHLASGSNDKTVRLWSMA
jgi:WD40 repeat protein